MWKSCTVKNTPSVRKHCNMHAWDSGFYRKTLPSQSNASQVMSESCWEKFHWFEFHLAIITNPAFATALLKLFKLYHLKKTVILKIVLYTKASNSTKEKKKKIKEKKSDFRIFDKEKTPCEAVNTIQWAKTEGWFSVFCVLCNHNITTCPPQSHHSVSKVCSVKETLGTWEVRNDNCFSCMDLA